MPRCFGQPNILHSERTPKPKPAKNLPNILPKNIIKNLIIFLGKISTIFVLREPQHFFFLPKPQFFFQNHNILISVRKTIDKYSVSVSSGGYTLHMRYQKSMLLIRSSIIFNFKKEIGQVNKGV